MNHRILQWDGRQWREWNIETPDEEVGKIAQTLEEYGVHATPLKRLISNKPNGVESDLVKGLLERSECVCGYNPETGYRTNIFCPVHDA